MLSSDCFKYHNLNYLDFIHCCINPAPHTALTSDAPKDTTKVNVSEFPFDIPVIANFTDQKDKNKDPIAHSNNDFFVFMLIVNLFIYYYL